VYELGSESYKILKPIADAYRKQHKLIRITVDDETAAFFGAKTFEAVPHEWCYETIDDDEDVDAINFALPDGREIGLAGQWIENWEVVK